VASRVCEDLAVRVSRNTGYPVKSEEGRVANGTMGWDP